MHLSASVALNDIIKNLQTRQGWFFGISWQRSSLKYCRQWWNSQEQLQWAVRWRAEIFQDCHCNTIFRLHLQTYDNLLKTSKRHPHHHLRKHRCCYSSWFSLLVNWRSLSLVGPNKTFKDVNLDLMNLYWHFLMLLTFCRRFIDYSRQ